jgi:DNA-binding MarR family transcriptional regulator
MTGFDPSSLDDVIHGRVRLAIMSYLSTAGTADFIDLREKTQSTDGNLSTHLKKLEDAGYVAQHKRFVGRKPQTTIELTETGRNSFVRYLEALNDLLKDAQGMDGKVHG